MGSFLGGLTAGLDSPSPHLAFPFPSALLSIGFFLLGVVAQFRILFT